MTADRFLVGYAVPSGEPVYLELGHLVITGQTQKAGKTTALEAWTSHLEPPFKALVFRTKRNELGFEGADPVRPFYKPNLTWSSLEGVISAHLQEKVKALRAILMQVVRGARSLDDVASNVHKAQKKVREGSFDEKLYIELDQYLSEILPSLKRLDLAPALELHPGLNVMDLVGENLSTQELLIGCALEEIHAHHDHVVVVIPEAWKIVPQNLGSPVKRPAETLIREGAVSHNFVWLDSQEVTGVQQAILKSTTTAFFGRQSHDGERARIAEWVGAKGADLARRLPSLPIGHFIVYADGDSTLVYVRPEGVNEDLAVDVARGKAPVQDVQTLVRSHKAVHAKEKVIEMDAKKEGELNARIHELEKRNADQARIIQNQSELEEHIAEIEQINSNRARIIEDQGAKIRILIDRVHALAKKAGIEGAQDQGDVEHEGPESNDSPVPFAHSKKALHIDVAAELSHICIAEQEVRVDTDTDSSDGQLAVLISEGFFDIQQSNGATRNALRSRGWGSWTGGAGDKAMRNLLEKFTTWGFLERVEGNKKVVYVARDGVKARITRTKTPVRA